MKGFHFFHSWKVTQTERRSAVVLSLFLGPSKEEVIKEVEECSECHKKRGFIYYLNGQKQECHPDF